jgi:hypothetical protein
MKLDIRAQHLKRGDVVDLGPTGTWVVADVIHGPESTVTVHFRNGERRTRDANALVRVISPDDADSQALDEIAAIIRQSGVAGKVRRVSEVLDRVRPEPPKLDPLTVLVDVNAHGQVVAVVEDEAAAPALRTYRIPLLTLRALRPSVKWRLPEMPPSELTRELDTWERRS